MNCTEIQNLLHAYVDGELDAARNFEIEQHLHSCPDCRSVQRNLATLKRGVTTSAPYFKAPADLRHRVLAAVRETAGAESDVVETPRTTRSYRPPWSWAIGMAACLAIGFFSAQFVAPRHTEDSALVRELTACHVRSLLATHLMDVVSTDQHTVKPWFDGKLDFAPPVKDLATSGYPLLGGRLDYIGGRTVAVLIYKRQNHVINLFIWPSANNADAPQAGNWNGYNLVQTNAGGMTYWAVSDVNQESLAEFAKLVTTPNAPAPKPGD